MAFTVKLYGPGLLAVCKNDLDWEADTMKLLIATSSYTPDLDAHDFANDITNEVANGGGYSTGGVALTTKTLTYNAATDQVRFDCDDPVFAFSAAKTWRYGVVYKSRGGASSADELLALLDWGADQTVSTPYTLTIDATGLLQHTRNPA